ncbi:MAG: hypothetical protein ACRD3O_02055 [Terriglobia bacterium]
MMIDRIANGRTDLVFEYLEQSLMSLRDTPNYEKKRTQPSPRGEGGERSEPGEGSRPNFSGQSLMSLRDTPKHEKNPSPTASRFPLSRGERVDRGRRSYQPARDR